MSDHTTHIQSKDWDPLQIQNIERVRNCPENIDPQNDYAMYERPHVLETIANIYG